MSQGADKIPLNRQNARAIGGLDINRVSYEEILQYSNAYSYTLSDHRDDYYILVIIIKGSGTLQCDMEKVVIKPDSVLLIRPYQVHSALQISDNAEAYFLSIAPFLMPDHCSNVFQGLTVAKQHLKVSSAEKKVITDTASLLQQAFMENNRYKTFIIHSLFNALINRIAAIFSDAENPSAAPKNQSQLIVQKFRQLVSEHSFSHPPSYFSEKLNITTSHLNDCLKAATGASVTHYLQGAMLLEAKRNLYYTNDDVKTIAFRLGFEAHTYFSRLFRKLAKETPLSFRNKFRE